MNQPLEAGTVYAFDRDGHDEPCTVTILKVETLRDVDIVHASIYGFKDKHGKPRTAGHLPFAAEVIEQAEIRFLARRDVPEFEDGYQTWRSAFDEGKAGVFTIGLNEVVDVLLQAIDG